MYFLRKTFELAVCLLGYWMGKGFGGWGGGILLALVGLCATSFGWEWLAQNIFCASGAAQRREAFRFRCAFDNLGRWRSLCVVGQMR